MCGCQTWWPQTCAVTARRPPAQLGLCESRRGTLCVPNKDIVASQEGHCVFSTQLRLCTAYIASINRLYTGLKSPKNINSATNGVGKPPFGLKLCKGEATGLRMPLDTLTGLGDQHKRPKMAFPWVLGPGPWARALDVRCGTARSAIYACPPSW